MKRILGLCTEVAEGLQSDNLIIDQAQEIVRGLKSALTVPMLPEPDDEWGKLYREANEIIEFCNLPNLPARTIRRARVDRGESQMIWEGSDHYRRYLYIPLCQKVVNELTQRFLTDELNIVYSAIGALSPKSVNFMDIGAITRFAILYNLIKDQEIEREVLSNQIKILSNLISPEEEDIPTTLLELLNYVIPFEKCMPSLTSCLKIAVTLPCTTASNERSFGLMARIKDKKRSTMLDSRLQGLGLLGVNREITLNIDDAVLIDKFAYNKRRIILN